MKIGSLEKNASVLGLLLATSIFCLLRVVLGINAFLSMIIGLIIGLVLVGMCEGLWEKTFRRKELQASKLNASFLKDRVKLLTTGDSVDLDQYERRMILSAIEYVPFREAIELPETRAFTRKVWRGLREKIQLSIKKEDKIENP